jgi:hypothetical protein
LEDFEEDEDFENISNNNSVSINGEAFAGLTGGISPDKS